MGISRRGQGLEEEFWGMFQNHNCSSTWCMKARSVYKPASKLIDTFPKMRFQSPGAVDVEEPAMGQPLEPTIGQPSVPTVGHPMMPTMGHPMHPTTGHPMQPTVERDAKVRSSERRNGPVVCANSRI